MPIIASITIKDENHSPKESTKRKAYWQFLISVIPQNYQNNQMSKPSDNGLKGSTYVLRDACTWLNHCLYKITYNNISNEYNMSNFIPNITFDLFCSRCCISVHVFKSLRIAEFLFIDPNTENRRKRRTPLWYYALLLTKVKLQLKYPPQKRMCLVYGEGIVNARTYQKWFVRFSARNCSLNENSWSSITFEISRNQNFIW